MPDPWETNNVGRPPKEPKAVTAACVAKVFFNKTYEEAESWTKSSKLFTELTSLDSIPQSVMQRGMENLPKEYTKELCKKLTVQFRRKGVNVVVDSSGVKLRTSSLWYDIRIKKKTRKKEFLKLHIAGCFDTGIIHGFTITKGSAGDSPQFKEMLGVFQKVLKAAADSAYLARKNCTLVKDKGGKPYFKLKVNTTAKPKSHPAWKAMVKLYWKDPESWNKEYHIRSYVEAIFASIKKRFGNFLRSIKKANQEKELSFKVVCYNVIRVLYLEAAKKLGIPLWVKPK